MKFSLLKTAVKGLIVGAAVFAFAGAAGATTTINLYGATAQTNFWNGAAADMLHVLFGCATGAATVAGSSSSNVTHGTGCSSSFDAVDDSNHNGIINFSYTNKASWDGIMAVNGVWDSTNNGGAAQPCTNANERSVATCVGTSCATANMTCQAITIGTSDVEASAFSQLSSGYQYGPLTGGATALSRGFFLSDGITAGIDTTNLQPASTPIAYPFGFYVNPQVTTTRCTTSSPAAYINNYCLTETDCGGTVGTTTYCKAQTIDNLSRLQIVALFGGSIANWHDFGAYYASLPVTLCMRHAGSGTSATLDLGIMEGNGWGNALVQGENAVGGTHVAPYVYFNDGTGDAQNCLKWVGGQSFSTERTTVPSTVLGGGVGYWDADAGPYAGSNGVSPNPACQSGVTAPCGAYAGPIKFNGVLPTRITMHDGMYDNFWTVNRMYVNTALTGVPLTMFQDIVNYLNSPANVTNALASGVRGLYYGAADELNFSKGSSITYPYGYSPCSGSGCANPD